MLVLAVYSYSFTRTLSGGHLACQGAGLAAAYI
ncbi:MAG: hypothetical protein JWS12_247 [Candidatus Saccharibacteria bacterium]|nr:hypothetical protein [Candidatus Saccharibacteria bacterium]